MDQKVCQSCGMPMQEEQYGKNGDGSPNEEYCMYCFKDGSFTQDCDLEGMVEICAPFEVESKRAATLEEARSGLREYLAALGRWKA